MALLSYYFGSLGLRPFYVKREDNHLFFSRYYHEMKVSWQLNSAGRIDRITGVKRKLPPEKKKEDFVTFVSIDGHKEPQKEKAWQTATATLFPLPRELYSINLKFAHQPKHQQYYSLFTFGHQMVRECFAGIVQGVMLPRHGQKKNPREQPLSDIRQGMLEYVILEQAAALVPRIYVDEILSKANVRYELFKD